MEQEAALKRKADQTDTAQQAVQREMLAKAAKRTHEKPWADVASSQGEARAHTDRTCMAHCCGAACTHRQRGSCGMAR
jgi:hypothetical protein